MWEELTKVGERLLPRRAPSWAVMTEQRQEGSKSKNSGTMSFNTLEQLQLIPNFI